MLVTCARLVTAEKYWKKLVHRRACACVRVAWKCMQSPVRSLQEG